MMTDADDARMNGHAVLLYDGVCALCNGIVRFVLRRDRRGIFLFAPLESEAAQRLLGTAASSAEGVAVVTDAGTPQQQVFRRSDAVAEALRLLGWRRRAKLLQVVPRPLREAGYAVVARVRYRLFGRYGACPLPSAEVRGRFLGF